MMVCHHAAGNLGIPVTRGRSGNPEQLHELMSGKTVNSASLIYNCAMNRLVVMDSGQMLETGSHNQLLAANGLYSWLWRRQSDGFPGECCVAKKPDWHYTLVWFRLNPPVRFTV